MSKNIPNVFSSCLHQNLFYNDNLKLVLWAMSNLIFHTEVSFLSEDFHAQSKLRRVYTQGKDWCVVRVWAGWGGLAYRGEPGVWWQSLRKERRGSMQMGHALQGARPQARGRGCPCCEVARGEVSEPKLGEGGIYLWKWPGTGGQAHHTEEGILVGKGAVAVMQV